MKKLCFRVNTTEKLCAMQSEVLGVELGAVVKNAKVLVVGAGGIGCELLKNLVLTGFEDIEIVMKIKRRSQTNVSKYFCSSTGFHPIC